MIGSAATVTSISLSCDSTACITWRTTAESSTTRTWIFTPTLSCGVGVWIHFHDRSINRGHDASYSVVHRMQTLRVPHEQEALRRQVTQQSPHDSFPVFP